MRDRWDHLGKRWESWISRRAPRQATVVLDQRRLFIFPSRAGLVFLFIQLLLLLVAINYQNNLIYGLVFLLGTVLVITIHITFNNLHGLTISATEDEPIYLGDTGSVSFLLVSGRERPGLSMGWRGADQSTNLVGPAHFSVSLPVKPKQRGWFESERFLIETRFPFGLVRCWSWVNVTSSLLVYPKPIAPVHAPRASSEQQEGKELRKVESGDDLYELRDYRKGDSLKNLHWPSIAKVFEPSVRVMGDTSSQAPDIIDFEDYPGVDLETRLSWLCFRVLSAASAGCAFALKLPHVELPMDSGPAHRDSALAELALFGVEGKEDVSP